MAESFFAGAGALRGAYEGVDWDLSPLGPVESWSPTLRAVLGMAWRTRFPVTLFWGPQQVMLYNEAYVPLILDKHPHALGSSTQDTFPEVWDTIGPMIARVMAGGEAVWVQDAHLPLRRRGQHLADAWFTFSYSAVHGPDGVIEGVIDIATETTEQVLGQRRLVVLADVSAALADADDEQHAAEAVLKAGLRALGCDGGAVHLLEVSTAAHRAPVEATHVGAGDPVEPGPDPHTDNGRAGVQLQPCVVAVDGVVAAEALREAVDRAAGRAIVDALTVGVSATSLVESAPAGASAALEVVIGVAASGDEVVAGQVASGSVDAVALPLLADGGVLGAVTAAWSVPQQLDAVELAPLRAVAAQYAEAVQRVRARRAEQASTVRMAHVTESMAVGYLAMDAEWRITHVNAEGRRVLGAVGADLTGQVLWELFPATVGTQYETNYRRAVATGQVVAFDAYYPAPLSTWFEIRATPEGDGLALYFLDITARITAEQARQAAADRVRVLAEVALTLSTIDDPAELLEVMAERGSAALGTDGAAVAIPDHDDPQMLRSYITASHTAAVRQEYATYSRDEPVPAAEAMRTRHPVLLGDRHSAIAYSPAMAHAVDTSGSVAFACLPLLAGEQTIGVFTATWNTPQDFDAEQVELLGAFAAQCSQGLQRLTALDGERRARREAEASALDARRFAEDALLSARRQAALVAIARALSAADSERDVLQVLENEGAALLAADGSGLALREPDGQHVRTLASDTFDADLRADVQRVPADFPMPIIHSAATGATHLFRDRASTVAVFPGAEALYTAAGVQASACLPLRGRTGLLGSISLAFAGERAFTSEERDLLEAFATLIAQALERIAADAAEQAALVEVAGIAETLQRSMLTAPPEPDHLQIAVRYAASAKAAEVGGDWYDAFITSGGITSLVIGDVTGHDIRAAAVMGQLRNVVRAIAFTLGEPPARVLAAVDRAAAGLGIDTVATAILAQVEVDDVHRAAGTRLLRWSNAGHLPPLLIEADGTTRFLEGEPDLVLGWDPSIERHDHEHVLAPGAVVLLFTDGLVERRGVSVERGLAWLAEAASELATSSEVTLEELCDALVELVGDHLDDDVALLALKAHPEDAPRPTEAGPAQVPARLDEALAAAQDAVQNADS